MKRILGLLFVIILISSCSIFDEPETELEKLPKMTQTGRGTFGCLVNGQAVRITNSMIMRAETQQNVFLIRFSNTVENKLWADYLKRFEFNMADPLEIGVEYDLTDGDLYQTRYINFINNEPNCIYEPENIISGNLTFSNIDRIKYIVSGTFEFETVNQSCDTIKVTNGRFDLKYHPY